MIAMGVYLFLGGMAAASAVTACGRLVTGWFPPEKRALAMGIRQTAQPLGIAVGAVVLPELAKHDFSRALLFPAVACAVMAVASLLVSTTRRGRRARWPTRTNWSTRIGRPRRCGRSICRRAC